MTDEKKADAPAKKTKVTAEPKGAVVDHLATSPSNDPNREANAVSTATEPNSKQRVAEKKAASHTGRANGGGGDESGYGRPGVGRDFTPDTLGEREAVSPGDTDLIWTNSSKDRWGVGEPSLADLLGQRNRVNKDLAEQDK